MASYEECASFSKEIYRRSSATTTCRCRSPDDRSRSTPVQQINDSICSDQFTGDREQSQPCSSDSYSNSPRIPDPRTTTSTWRLHPHHRTFTSSYLNAVSSIRSIMIPALLFTLLTLSSSGVNASSSDYFIEEPQTEPHYFDDGQQIDLTLPCRVKPQYTSEDSIIYWTLKKRGSSATQTVSSDGNPTISGFQVDTSCEGCFNLIFPKQSAGYRTDDGNYSCKIHFKKRGVDAVYSDSASIIVLIKPKSPELFDYPTGDLIEGQANSFKCRSAGGNPAPRITWSLGGNGVANAEIDHSDKSVVEQIDAIGLDNYTIGTLHWSFTAEQNGASLACHVKNAALQSELSISQPVTVNYKPRVTVGPGDTYRVAIGDTVNLNCNADANPRVIEWRWLFTPSNPRQPPSITGLSSASLQQKNQQFIAKKESSGKYSCVAMNQVGNGSAGLSVEVLYPPMSVSQAEELNKTVDENQRVSLICKVDANPNIVTYQWVGPNGQQAGNDKEIVLGSVQRTDAGRYQCIASNQMNLTSQPSTSAPSSTTINFYLKVSHAPGTARIRVEPNPPVVNQVVRLYCESDDIGEPKGEPIWTYESQTQPFEATQNPKIITGAQVHHSGMYYCALKNDAGTGEQGSIELMVHEPSKITSDPSDAYPTENASLEEECKATGFPAPMITWYKDGVLINPQSTTRFLMTQTDVDTNASDCASSKYCAKTVTGKLTFKNGVKWVDNGKYRCAASNKAGRADEREFKVEVTHKPYFVTNPALKYVAAKKFTSASIICKVQANPAPTSPAEWSFKGNTIEDRPDDRVHLQGNDNERTNREAHIYAYMLQITSVTPDRFGAYKCKVHNQEGSAEFTYILQEPSKPMQPSTPEVSTIGTSSIKIQWIPGFDGGHTQHYLVELKMPDGKVKQFDTSKTRDKVNLRERRSSGIEEIFPTTFEIDGLKPSQNYEVRIKAKNELDETDFTPWASFKTDNPEISSDIAEPKNVEFDPSDYSLTFESRDIANWCLQIYTDSGDSSPPQSYDCVTPTGQAKIDVNYEFSNVQARYCKLSSQEMMRCSAYVVAKKLDVDANEAQTKSGNVPLNIVIPVVVVIAALIIIIAIVACCCWSKRRDKTSSTSTPRKPKEKSKLVAKDYESETNQIRPKNISAPFVASDREGQAATTGSKDSGVFTTNGSVANYNQYDTQYAAEDNGGFSNDSFHHNNNFNSPNGQPYDDGNGWGGDAPEHYDPFGNGYLPSHDYPDNNQGTYPGQSPYEMSAYPGDPYAAAQHNMVDMNPQGVSPLQDGSMNSGYSTPNSNSRRVMREIIV